MKDKDRAPAFQFYPRQFSGDEQIQSMDRGAVGAHILLMCAAAASPERYRMPCRSDADWRAIRMLIRNPNDVEWEDIKAQLLRGAWKISEDQQWLVQEGLYRTFLKQKKFSDEQRDRANSRWRKTDTGEMPDVCRKDAEIYAGLGAPTLPETCSSSSSSSSITDISSKPPASTDPRLIEDLTTVWEYYLTAVDRNPKIYSLTPKRKSMGLARLRECLHRTGGDHPAAVELMKVAVDALAKSDFHMGRDPKTAGKKYCGWEHLFRSTEQIERWWE
jgi:hypothetical protein